LFDLKLRKQACVNAPPVVADGVAAVARRVVVAPKPVQKRVTAKPKPVCCYMLCCWIEFSFTCSIVCLHILFMFF